MVTAIQFCTSGQKQFAGNPANFKDPSLREKHKCESSKNFRTWCSFHYTQCVSGPKTIHKNKQEQRLRHCCFRLSLATLLFQSNSLSKDLQ